MRYTRLTSQVADFMGWVNREDARQNLSGQTISKDQGGPIGLSRFRRTLAWHITRRPGGLVTLAIQYGRMRTILDARTSTADGTRSRRGIHAEFDVETALAAADTAARLNDRMAAGEKVSGPASLRALTAAATTPRFGSRGVTWKFAQKAAAFLSRDGLVLFDNPDAYLTCLVKSDTALCDPAPDATAPNQLACQLGCGYAVRTDTDARNLRESAREIDTLAAVALEPVGSEAQTDRLRELAGTHDATAQRAEALTERRWPVRTRPRQRCHGPAPGQAADRLQRQPDRRRAGRRAGRPPHGPAQAACGLEERDLRACPCRDDAGPGG
ncbi:hypothetical protein [Streptomyces sp. NPDC059489]|uniref:hypothetical protein n=1 Tax=Streptomyces sp. NPDC059489 TaxID=3346849 RepID=UPI0036754819